MGGQRDAGTGIGAWADSAQAVAAEEYSTESAKASQSLLIDATHAGKRLVVVGDRGHILFSDDQGSTWTQARVPTRQLLTAVFFLDDKRGWAVGHDAQILASSDGGATWSKQFEDLAREAPLLDVTFLDASTALPWGPTAPAGNHRRRAALAGRGRAPGQPRPVAPQRHRPVRMPACSSSASRAACSAPRQRPDLGKTSAPTRALFGVIGTAQPQTLLAYGLRGNLFRSSDFGDSWQQVELKAARVARWSSAWQALRLSMMAAWCWSATAAACCAARRRPDLQRTTARPPRPGRRQRPGQRRPAAGRAGGVHLAFAKGPPPRRCAMTSRESITMHPHHQDKATLLERLIFNNRPVVIALCLLVSIFLFWQATQIRPSTSFEKMIPLQHPFIEQMMEHRNDLANLGNTVRISVEAVNGDIFDKDYMETLRQIHDEVFYIPGVDRAGLKSLWSPACAGPKSPKRALPAAR
jgi:hypothetical protein